MNKKEEFIKKAFKIKATKKHKLKKLVKKLYRKGCRFGYISNKPSINKSNFLFITKRGYIFYIPSKRIFKKIKAKEKTWKSL